MPCRVFESELNILEVLWREGDCPARYLADVMTAETGWNINTTYTVIKRCISKGLIQRIEPGYRCHALITREQIQEEETDELIQKVYGGSEDLLFAALLGRRGLSQEKIEQLKQMIQKMK